MRHNLGIRFYAHGDENAMMLEAIICAALWGCAHYGLRAPAIGLCPIRGAFLRFCRPHLPISAIFAMFTEAYFSTVVNVLREE